MSGEDPIADPTGADVEVEVGGSATAPGSGVEVDVVGGVEVEVVASVEVVDVVLLDVVPLVVPDEVVPDGRVVRVEVAGLVDRDVEDFVDDFVEDDEARGVSKLPEFSPREVDPVSTTVVSTGPAEPDVDTAWSVVEPPEDAATFAADEPPPEEPPFAEPCWAGPRFDETPDDASPAAEDPSATGAAGSGVTMLAAG